jgi:MFS family permease
VICLVAGFMTLLDVSSFNVALPAIERGLHMSPAEVSWSVAGYALTFGLILISSSQTSSIRQLTSGRTAWPDSRCSGTTSR